MAQPVLTDITRIEFDPQFSPGAYNAVNTCLRIQPSEKVTLITDNACREIAASIAAESRRERSAAYRSGVRPVRTLSTFSV